MLREVKSLLKVESEFVVKYHNSWTEGPQLYIQMEFCSQSLRQILDSKPQLFGRQSGQPVGCVEYYLSGHIFRELLECVAYIHGLQPQIIHRDLKAENVLIANNPTNGRFLKLCAFGLATDHDPTVHYL